MDSAIDTTTGTVKLRAQFANPDEMLFPNQFVNAKLLIDTLKGATVIPTAAVQRGQPGTFVYLVKPDDTVAVQKIQLGPQDGERVAVTSGLDPGEQVVIDGADKLRDGAKIALHQETPAPANASAAPQPPAGQPAQQPQSAQPTQAAPPAAQQPAIRAAGGAAAGSAAATAEAAAWAGRNRRNRRDRAVTPQRHCRG